MGRRLVAGLLLEAALSDAMEVREAPLLLLPLLPMLPVLPPDSWCNCGVFGQIEDVEDAEEDVEDDAVAADECAMRRLAALEAARVAACEARAAARRGRVDAGGAAAGAGCGALVVDVGVTGVMG